MAPQYTEDMSNVPAADDLVPEGQYTFRIASVKIDEGAGTDGADRINYGCHVQDEGPAFGRNVNHNIDYGDSRGRSNLKTLYKACGYNPGPEGHDPERIIDGEFKGTIKHNVQASTNNKFANIVPWTIKSILAH